MSKRRFRFPNSLFHHPPSILHPPSSIVHFIRRNVPWAAVDAVITLLSLALALSARALTTSFDVHLILPFSLVAIGVCCTVDHLCSLYHRIWRYASAGEIVWSSPPPSAPAPPY